MKKTAMGGLFDREDFFVQVAKKSCFFLKEML